MRSRVRTRALSIAGASAPAIAPARPARGLLTVEECRKLAPELAERPNTEVIALRDTLYALTHGILDAFDSRAARPRGQAE